MIKGFRDSLTESIWQLRIPVKIARYSGGKLPLRPSSMSLFMQYRLAAGLEVSPVDLPLVRLSFSS